MAPLLLLHGFLGSSADFQELGALLPGSRKVDAPDWPGHGARGRLRDPSAYTLEAHLSMVVEWIRAQEEPGVLLGYSMGGRLLQHALARLPDLCPDWRVILVSTSPGIADPSEAANRREGDAAAARLLRDAGMDPFLRYWHNQTFFRPLLDLPPERLDPILARRRSADPEGLALSLESVGPGSVPSTHGVLSRLRCRLDLVAGSADPSYVRHAESMAAIALRATVTVVPGAGHALHLEQPGALAALLA